MDKLPQISEAEYEIMKIIWDESPISTNSICEKVPSIYDDVISMGGTICRLVEQKHDVHVAYETSGNIAVGDEEVIRFLLLKSWLKPLMKCRKRITSSSPTAMLPEVS